MCYECREEGTTIQKLVGLLQIFVDKSGLNKRKITCISIFILSAVRVLVVLLFKLMIVTTIMTGHWL